MASTSPIVLDGLVTDQRQLEIEVPASVPIGPVRVTLEPMEVSQRMPDPPWLDECIPAPFDLPYSGEIEYVDATYVEERLPDPIFILIGSEDGICSSGDQ